MIFITEAEWFNRTMKTKEYEIVLVDWENARTVIRDVKTGKIYIVTVVNNDKGIFTGKMQLKESDIYG